MIVIIINFFQQSSQFPKLNKCFVMREVPYLRLFSRFHLIMLLGNTLKVRGCFPVSGREGVMGDQKQDSGFLKTVNRFIDYLNSIGEPLKGALQGVGVILMVGVIWYTIGSQVLAWLKTGAWPWVQSVRGVGMARIFRRGPALEAIMGGRSQDI